MARVARKHLLYSDCYAHVFSRSSGQYQIFGDDDDFEKFKALIGEGKLWGQF